MSSSCPLLDPSLDIIPTNAHFVGNCLCQFCTCGKHLCPRMNIQDPFPKGTFTTKYMAEYKKGRFDVPVKPEPRKYRPNKMPMDLLTSNQDDYKYSQVNPATPIRPLDSKTPKKPVLSTITINTYNYPNWGPNKLSHEKRWDPPVRTTELRFKGKSSYSRSFSPILPGDAKRFQTNYTDSTAFQTSFSIGPQARLDARTTYSEKMKNFSGNGFNTRIKVKAPSIEIIQSSPSHYSTTSNSFYSSPINKKDPRQMRIILESRGLEKLMN